MQGGPGEQTLLTTPECHGDAWPLQCLGKPASSGATPLALQSCTLPTQLSLRHSSTYRVSPPWAINVDSTYARLCPRTA